MLCRNGELNMAKAILICGKTAAEQLQVRKRAGMPLSLIHIYFKAHAQRIYAPVLGGVAKFLPLCGFPEKTDYL